MALPRLDRGNALAVYSRLGLADDPRVAVLASVLQEWQWPDGGWNCDPAPEASHGSFHESLTALWGLGEYQRAIENRGVESAIAGAREFFLRHHLIRSERTGEIINRRWLSPHYPPYWHYDVYQGLLVLSRVGGVNDPRVQEALDLVQSARRRDGWWYSSERYWRRKREAAGKPNEVVGLGSFRAE